MLLRPHQSIVKPVPGSSTGVFPQRRRSCETAVLESPQLRDSATLVEDDISTSTHHVLRGVHGDGRTWKLVSCLVGRFYLLVVNNDQAHPQYRKWQGLTLSDGNRHQVLIPPKFGNGHVVMSDVAVFHYKQSSSYDRASQFTLLWNDPAFDFWWPVGNPIVSRRDLGLE